MSSLLDELELSTVEPLRPELRLVETESLTIEPPAPSPMQIAWDKWKPEVEKASADSLFPVAQVEEALKEGRAILWPGSKSAMITEVENYCGKKVLRVWWGLGDLEELKAMQAGVEAWGRLQGCVMALVEGREGWEKTLKATGFEHYSTTLKKAL